MIHTVNLFCEVDMHYYNTLFETIKKMSSAASVKFYKEKDGTYHSHLLQKNGIILILRQVKRQCYSALEIRMNPIRLIDENNYIQLTEKRHVKQIYQRFEKALLPIKLEFERSDVDNEFSEFILHKIDSYKFCRVDFAIDISVECIDLYMEVVNGANIPEGFIQYMPYDLVSKRRKPLENSFYIFRKKGNGKAKQKEPPLTISCYNKIKQMEHEKLPCDGVKPVIRFEVQCRYKKVYDLLAKMSGNDKSTPESATLATLLSKEISDHILRYYFKKTIGYGDYYTLQEAKQMIEDTQLKQKKKKALLETLELVNERRGIWKAKETVPDKADFEKNIKELHKLGINPVTIPTKWKVDHLPCLFKQKGKL